MRQDKWKAPKPQGGQKIDDYVQELGESLEAYVNEVFANYKLVGFKHYGKLATSETWESLGEQKFSDDEIERLAGEWQEREQAATKAEFKAGYRAALAEIAKRWPSEEEYGDCVKEFIASMNQAEHQEHIARLAMFYMLQRIRERMGLGEL